MNSTKKSDPDLQTHTMGDRSALTKSLTLAAMSLGYGVVQLDVTIVNTALHSMGSSLGGGVDRFNGLSAPTRLRLRHSF